MAENKERLSSAVTTSEAEIKRPAEMVDERAELVVPREVETWLQKIEKDTTQLSVVNDQNGQPILSPAAPSNPKIKLPVTRRNFVAGFKKPFEEAARWVSAFFLRFIRIKKGWVVFKEE